MLQRLAVWQAFQRGTGINVTQLGELEMEGLGQFICGLQPAQIDQLNSTSLRLDIFYYNCSEFILARPYLCV